jgi:hypothetical protein
MYFSVFRGLLLHNWTHANVSGLNLMFINCKYTSVVTKPITLQVHGKSQRKFSLYVPKLKNTFYIRVYIDTVIY